MENATPPRCYTMSLTLLFIIAATSVTVGKGSTCSDGCGDVGVCFDSGANGVCYLDGDSNDDFDTQSSCEYELDHLWCGDDSGKIGCSTQVKRSKSNIAICGECHTSDSCLELGQYSSGSDAHGHSYTTVGVETFSKWCPDAASSGCVFGCTNGEDACKGAEFFCGTSTAGKCQLTCDGTGACKGARLHCGENKDCYVDCTGINACKDLSIQCPDPPFKCEVNCYGNDAGNCANLDVSNCGDWDTHEYNPVNSAAVRSAFMCDHRDGKVCTNIRGVSNRQEYLDLTSYECTSYCQSGLFHIVKGSPEFSRTCGPCPINADCGDYDRCVVSACLEQDGSHFPLDNDCCAVPSQGKCESGYDEIFSDGGVGGNAERSNKKCFAEGSLNVYSTCCRQSNAQATCGQVTDGVFGGNFLCAAGSSLKADPDGISCDATPGVAGCTVSKCCDPAPVPSPTPERGHNNGDKYTLSVNLILNEQEKMVEGGTSVEVVISPGRLDKGIYKLHCNGVDASNSNKHLLYVTGNGKHTLTNDFYTTNTTIQDATDIPSSRTWRIYVRSPLDASNEDPDLRSASIFCILYEDDILVARVEKKINILNVVRPSIGFADLSYDVLKDSDDETKTLEALFKTNQIQFEGINQINKLGRLEIITSDGASLLRLFPHPDFQFGPWFTKSKVYLTHEMGNKIELENVYITDDQRILVVGLPSFHSIPQCSSSSSSGSSSSGSASCEVCRLGVEIVNDQSDLLKANTNSPTMSSSIPGATFRCPPTSNTSVTCYTSQTSSVNIDSSHEDLTSSGSAGSYVQYPQQQQQQQQQHRWVLRYVPQCKGYNKSGSSFCSLSILSAQTCAFGLCDKCRPCPLGAICPGGFRATSFPGYYTVSSAAGIVVRCPRPALERCIGFNETTQQTVCGEKYTGMKCSRCRKDYFEASDLSCQKCPNPLNKHNRLLHNAIPFALVILLSSIFMMCTIWYLEHVRHGERLKRVFECCSLPKIAVRQTKEFTVWVILSAQVLASASQAPIPGLPFWILDIYGVISFFNLDMENSAPPQCAGNPFDIPTTVLSGILILTMVQASIFAIGIIVQFFYEFSATPLPMPTRTTTNSQIPVLRSEGSGGSSGSSGGTSGKLPLVCADFQGKVFMLLSFCFPLVTKQVYQMLHCEIDVSTGKNILVWSGGSRGGGGKNSSSSSTDNQVTECFTGEHLPVAILAWMAIVFYMILFPLLTFVYLRYRIVPAMLRTGDSGLNFRHSLTPTGSGHTIATKKSKPLSMKSLARLSRWDHFVSDDYNFQYFYFRHIYYGVTVALLGLYEYIDRSQHGGLRCLCILFLFGFYLLLLLKYRPFNEIDRWKLYVRVVIILCSSLIAVLDFVRWVEGEAETAAQKDQLYGTNAMTLPYSFSNASAPSSSFSSVSSLTNDKTNMKTVAATLPVSLILSYLVFASCLVLLVALPLSFFVVNYGACLSLCGWLCGTKYRHRRPTRDHSSLGNDEEVEDEDYIKTPSLVTGNHRTNDSLGSIEMVEVDDTNYCSDDEDERNQKNSRMGKIEEIETKRNWTYNRNIKKIPSSINIGFERHYDDNTGFYYLYNQETGETKWEDYEVAQDDTAENTLKRIDSFRSNPQLIKVESFRSDRGEEKTLLKISNDISQKRMALLEKARTVKRMKQNKLVNGWIEVVDDDLTTCYVFLETGEVKYDKPPLWVKTMAKMFNQGQNHNQNQGIHSTVAKKNEGVWTSHLDESSGGMYYVNKNTKRSTWTPQNIMKL